ncbi:MAG: hypothetical protein MJZ52_06105 [Bacteroidales bacterium]|nr:hypothetical protein [Bacteroidales bacterium]
MNTYEILFSCVSLLATIGIFTALYKIGKKIGIFEESIRYINQSTTQCENRINKLEDLSVSMHSDILAIKTFLITKYKNAESIWGVKNSPTKLSENGKMLFDAIRGDQFLLDNKSILLQQLSEKAPQTPLDVENDSNEILLRQTETEIFNGLKNWVYESSALLVNGEDGPRPYTITLNDVCFVLSIPLRDMYLEKHPELINNSVIN